MKFFVLVLIWQHFTFDWLLQPRWIAENKSKEYLPLFLHGCILFIALFAILLLFSITSALLKSICYVVLHCFQDKIIWTYYRAITDNFDKYWEDKLFYDFIAIDQTLHLTILFMICMR
jgi:hypothetical protein